MNKTLKIVLIVIGVLIICCVGSSIVGFFGYREVYKDAPLNVTYEVPDDVSVGDTFTWILKIENTSSNTVSINEIEFPEEFLLSANILNITPEFTSEESYEFLGFNYVSYYYDDLTIGGGNTVDVTIESEALSEGFASGTVTFYIDRLFNQHEQYIRFQLGE